MCTYYKTFGAFSPVYLSPVNLILNPPRRCLRVEKYIFLPNSVQLFIFVVVGGEWGWGDGVLLCCHFSDDSKNLSLLFCLNG